MSAQFGRLIPHVDNCSLPLARIHIYDSLGTKKGKNDKEGREGGWKGQAGTKEGEVAQEGEGEQTTLCAYVVAGYMQFKKAGVFGKGVAEFFALGTI
jgi:hypothetical protein